MSGCKLRLVVLFEPKKIGSTRMSPNFACFSVDKHHEACEVWRQRTIRTEQNLTQLVVQYEMWSYGVYSLWFLS